MCPLTINNTLLQSCYLRNTEWACGVAVYTGVFLCLSPTLFKFNSFYGSNLCCCFKKSKSYIMCFMWYAVLQLVIFLACNSLWLIHWLCYTPIKHNCCDKERKYPYLCLTIRFAQKCDNNTYYVFSSWYVSCFVVYHCLVKHFILLGTQLFPPLWEWYYSCILLQNFVIIYNLNKACRILHACREESHMQEIILNLLPLHRKYLPEYLIVSLVVYPDVFFSRCSPICW